MSVDLSSLSVERALNLALQSENVSVKAYSKLKKSVNNFVMKDKLQFLINEEKKHRKIVEGLLDKMYPGKDRVKVDMSIHPKLDMSLEEDASVIDLLEMAMESEKKAEEFYDSLAEEVEQRGIQEILQYLASMEHSHYFLLKGEYDLCIQDEEYYQRGDFQYDMVHIGP